MQKEKSGKSYRKLGLIGLVAIFLIGFISLPVKAASQNGDYGDVQFIPTNLTAVQGQTTNFYYEYSTGNPDVYAGYNSVTTIKVKYTSIPTGLTVSFNSGGVGSWNQIASLENGNVTLDYTGWIQVGSNANFNTPQNIEADFLINVAGGYGDILFHRIFTVTPLLAKEWDVSVSGMYGSLYKDENFLYTITIHNYLNQQVAWDILTDHILSGFNVNPSSGSLSIPPNGSSSFTTYIIANGAGLIQGHTYEAVRFNCYNRLRTTTVTGGNVLITYQSPPENVENFETWFDPVNINVPSGGYGETKIYIKNTGGATIKLQQINLTVVGYAAAADQHAPIELATNENDYYTIKVYPELDSPTHSIMIAKVMDNYGVTKIIQANLTLTEGNFSVTLIPDQVNLLVLASADIKLTIKNNENENRTYYVAWSNMGDIGFIASPSTAQITIDPYSPATITFTIYLNSNAYGRENSIIPFDVIITSDDNGYLDTALKVDILPVGGGANYPTNEGINGLAQIFMPLVHDPFMAGMMAGLFIIIMPLMAVTVGVISAASRNGRVEHSGIIILIMANLSIFICSISGVFPIWFVTFNVATMALYFMRGRLPFGG